jgi:hypothetical protein
MAPACSVNDPGRLAIAVAVCVGTSLLGCGAKRESDAQPAPRREPSARAPAALVSERAPPQLPLLQGRLRCEAEVALDARSEARLGGSRRYTLDELRAQSANGSMLVDARRTWTLRGSAITLRGEALYRESDGSYRSDSCEASAKVEWRNAGELIVPSDIAARSRSVAFSRDGRRASDCGAELPAGTYHVTTEGGELLARRDDPDGVWAFLLVPDPGVDFDAEAKRLSGFDAD